MLPRVPKRLVKASASVNVFFCLPAPQCCSGRCRDWLSLMAGKPGALAGPQIAMTCVALCGISATLVTLRKNSADPGTATGSRLSVLGSASAHRLAANRLLVTQTVEESWKSMSCTCVWLTGNNGQLYKQTPLSFLGPGAC